MSYRLCLPGSCSLAKDTAVTFSWFYGIVDWHTLSCLQETTETETISQLKWKRKSYSKIRKVYLLWLLLSAKKQDKLWPFQSISGMELRRDSLNRTEDSCRWCLLHRAGLGEALCSVHLGTGLVCCWALVLHRKAVMEHTPLQTPAV